MRPSVPAADAGWCRNPIDAFVLAKLREEGPDAVARGRPPHADPPGHFDLTGLPPTPEEVDAFVADAAPDAYERLVDRLLASPALRRALGAALARRRPLRRHARLRQGQAPRPTPGRYRDYVIRAFNDDKPYARFVAGAARRRRALPRRPADGVAALGFIAAGPWDFVGHVELREGTIDKQDRAATSTATTWCYGHVDTFVSLTVALRPLPRPQVRPDPAGGLLQPAGGLRGRRPRRPAVRSRPRGRRAEPRCRAATEQRRRSLARDVSRSRRPELAHLACRSTTLATRQAACERRRPEFGYHSALSSPPRTRPSGCRSTSAEPTRSIRSSSSAATTTSTDIGAGFGFPALQGRASRRSDFTNGRARCSATARRRDVPNPGVRPQIDPAPAATERRGTSRYGDETRDRGRTTSSSRWPNCRSSTPRRDTNPPSAGDAGDGARLRSKCPAALAANLVESALLRCRQLATVPAELTTAARTRSRRTRSARPRRERRVATTAWPRGGARPAPTSTGSSPRSRRRRWSSPRPTISRPRASFTPTDGSRGRSTCCARRRERSRGRGRARARSACVGRPQSPGSSCRPIDDEARPPRRAGRAGSSTRATRSPGGRSSTASGTTTSAAGSSRRPTTSAAWARSRRTPSCSTGWPPSSATAGGSLKHLHRLIVTSADATASRRRTIRRRPTRIDADNRYLWRMNRTRSTPSRSATPCSRSAASST